MLQIWRYSIGIIFILFVFASCKQEIKEKIDRLPNVDMKTLENIINNPQTAVKNSKIDDNSPKISIDNNTFDFGTIIQGEKVSHPFVITNIGLSDLRILDTKTSCGCTIAEYNSDPIKPGEKRDLAVTFDSASKLGDQSRVIHIMTNTFPTEQLVMMNGIVTKKK